MRYLQTILVILILLVSFSTFAQTSETTLLKAVNENDLDKDQSLISQKADVNAVGNNDTTNSCL